MSFYFISAVPREAQHSFSVCAARQLSAAKAMATRLVRQPGMKSAVAVAPSIDARPVPVAEIVYAVGCAWQSLFPSLEPVGLHHHD